MTEADIGKKSIASFKITVFLGDATPCSLVVGYQCFWQTKNEI